MRARIDNQFTAVWHNVLQRDPRSAQVAGGKRCEVDRVLVLVLLAAKNISQSLAGARHFIKDEIRESEMPAIQP